MSGKTASQVEVKYKCRCMREEATVFVQARTPDQDVRIWFQVFLQGGISTDHRARSPHCQADTMEYARLALPGGAEFIGQGDKLQ